MNTTNTVSSDALNTALVELITGTKTVVTETYSGAKDMLVGGINVLYEQAPELVNQFILYKRVELILLVLLSFVLGFVAYKFYEKCYKDDWDNPFYMLICIFSTIGSVAVFFCNIGDCIKINLAPKLYLLEYLAQFFR